MTRRMYNVVFIGGGNMTCSIIQGLLANGYHPSYISVAEHNLAQRNFLFQRYGVNVAANMAEWVNKTEVAILAVKPQGAKTVCQEVGKYLGRQLPMIISVMAGVTTTILTEWLGESFAIVRAMPNLPAAVGEGATGLYANDIASTKQQDIAESLLSTIGITAWVTKEEDMNTITALSGSGPAYYLYFMEIMQAAAIKMGLNEEIAEEFAIQTAYGAAKFARYSGHNLALLREQVTSKNGTTEAALNLMKSSNLSVILEEALQAAAKRALELSQAN